MAQEALQGPLVEGQGGLLVQAQGALRDRSRDPRIPVPVAPDPGAEAQEGGHRQGGFRVGGAEGLLHVPVEPGGHVPQGLLEVVEPVAHLIQDGGGAQAHLVRAPQGGDLLPDAVVQVGLRPLGEGAALQGLGQVAQPAQVVEHGAPAGLGGVGGEDRLHGAAGEEGLHGLRRDAGPGGAEQRLQDRLAPRGVSPVYLSPAQDAQAVMLFGHVDQVEVGGEGARHEAVLVRREAVHQGQQPGPGRAEVRRRAVFPAEGLGARPQLFYQGESGPAGLLGEDVAQEPAQGVDVPAEAVGVARAAGAGSAGGAADGGHAGRW